MDDGSPILAASRHLMKSNGSILGRDVARTIEPKFPSLASAIPIGPTTSVALASIDGRAPLSHSRIHQFIVEYFGPALHRLGFGKGHRIALILPNGPELALCLVATAHWSASVPLSANGAPAELEADLLRCGADLVIGPYAHDIFAEEDLPPIENEWKEKFCVMELHSHAGTKKNQRLLTQDYKVFAPIEECARKLGIPFVGLVPSPVEAGIFRLVVPSSTNADHAEARNLHFHDDSKASCDSLLLPPVSTSISVSVFDTSCNTARDEVLVLFTSGTTGNKKLVPHELGDMLTAATIIALSWDLTPKDINCNLMPLFHVGGIVRQVFSPLVSGGCVICCPSFDPAIFWQLMEREAFTWYYAAPTMHQLILQLHDPVQCPKPRLRMIANAAGGLLPSLALKMRETFSNVHVLPSYGMTECMPISSPPSTYDLSKPGTSGVPVGPEVAILNLGTLKDLPPMKEGPICVRGEPCFRGYGKLANDPSSASVETFLKDGWFNTGDLGYLDDDGYLYITGRSKEVINRGGEIISPMEVEEAVFAHPYIQECVAFSASHLILQEVVGIAVVMKKDCKRIDLPSLHAFLGDKLAAPKWPQCVVFLDALPKSHTNKLLRVKLGSRFGLPELRDDMPAVQRSFEGTCPPPGTSLDDPIPVRQVEVSAMTTEDNLKNAIRQLSLKMVEDWDLKIVSNLKRPGTLVCYVYGLPCIDVIETARESLDGYAVPTHFVTTDVWPSDIRSLPPPTMNDAADTILQKINVKGPVDPVVEALQSLFGDLLRLDYQPAPSANFFHIGGSSMLASQLASRIRKDFGVACSGAEIFHFSSGESLAKMIRKRRPSSSNRKSDDTISTTSDTTGDDSSSGGGGSAGLSSHDAKFDTKRPPIGCSWWAMGFQLVPMFVVFPIWQVTRYLLFFGFLLASIDVVPTHRNLGTFVLAYLCFHMCWVTITPLIFVAIKWIVIGRYRPGRYPLWGSYYLRWWFVDLCRQLFLRGIWGSNDFLMNMYYRLLGAKIGSGAKISLEADIAEFDLVTIGDGAAVEMSTVRGFGVDNGAMILGPVTVGNNSSVGVKSVVAPYTSIPDNSHLAPATSSYDVKALDPKFATVNRRLFPQASPYLKLLVLSPIQFLVNCFGQLPPLIVLVSMLMYKESHTEAFHSPSDLMRWLCDPRRIPFYIGIRIARAVISPFFYMAAALVAKKFFIGKFEAGPRDTSSQWQLLRHELSATLFSRKKIQNVVDLVGRHYELVSCLYRLLGAKVGKRVFWPGHQPIFSGEFDLLEIGDDIVWGSRSLVFTATTTTCEKVILCAGANVSDNCVVLPGSVVGKSATLGSNSICPRGWYLPDNSVWFGSQGGAPTCLEKGLQDRALSNLSIASAQIPGKYIHLQGDSSTLRPFGKAFYQRKASYFVWPLSWIVAAAFFIKTFIAVFHSLPLLAAFHGAAAIMYGLPIHSRNYEIQHSFLDIYKGVLMVFFVMNIVRVFLWLMIELTAKWSLIGRRQPGTYNYNSCSYAQRWELYQLICKIRKFSRFNFLQFFYGSPYMNFYFRLNGGQIGKDTCLYPAGADPFMPEPDLVQIGERCVIDGASMVCHLNTRGNFDLAPVIIQNDCTLQCRSRVQQGVLMEAGSQLLSKSVAMTGEVLEADSVWVGCPATWWFQYSSPVAQRRFMQSEKMSTGSLTTLASSPADEFDETSRLLADKSSSSSYYGV